MTRATTGPPAAAASGTAAATMADPAEARMSEQLRRGLRVAALLLASGTVFGLGLANVLRHLDQYGLPEVQLGAFAVLAGVLAVEAVLLLRRRSWERWAGPAVALVLAASLVSYLALPEGKTSTSVDWMFGAANWAGVIVLLDRPFRAAAAFLAAHELTAAAHLLLADEPSRAALARFATGSVNVIGLPLCVVVVASVLQGFAARATAATRAIERVRAEENAAAEAHLRRRERLAGLNATAVPILRGLAGGSLAPEDPDVQRRCAIEAARMRRLFAETDAVPDPLIHELRHCADVADRKGVMVEFDARGRCPELPVAVRRDLTEAALTALATAASWARVTVAAAPDLVTVGVVADCGAIDPPVLQGPEVSVETCGNEETVWMEATWQPVR